MCVRRSAQTAAWMAIVLGENAWAAELTFPSGNSVILTNRRRHRAKSAMIDLRSEVCASR